MSASPGTFQLKLGALLLLNMQVQQDDTTPVDITGATLFSEIRDQSGNLVATPTLTVVSATAGQFSYSAASTSSWPVGTVRTDVYLLIAGIPYFTQTFFVITSAAVTVPADRI